jgi:hypothetical protein
MPKTKLEAGNASSRSSNQRYLSDFKRIEERRINIGLRGRRRILREGTAQVSESGDCNDPKAFTNICP